MLADKKCKMVYDLILYAFILLILTTIVTYCINPDLRSIIQILSEKSPKDPNQVAGLDQVMTYIKHNAFMVPLQMLILALLPIPFLYLFNLLSTTIVLGIVFAIVLRYDPGQGTVLILGSLPHSFLEILGFSLFASLLYRLNNSLYRSLYLKFPFYHQRKSYHLKDESVYLVKNYCVWVLPIISIAALCETYIGEFIYHILG